MAKPSKKEKENKGRKEVERYEGNSNSLKIN